jgi:kynurenine formamidase
MGPGPQFQGPPIGSSTTAVEYYTGGDKLEYVWEHDYALTGTHNGPHLDAICHVAYEGKTYNGYSFKEVTSREGGCSKLAIANVKDKIVTRGVLIDIAAMKGVPQIAPGTAIQREDIEAFEKWAKVKVSPGDAFLYRSRGGVGIDPAVLPLLKQRDIALFGGDTAHDGAINVPGFPVAIHTVAMVAMGLNMFDNLNLEALAETCRKLKRWEFMLVATPTPAARGTGAQISPIAIF